MSLNLLLQTIQKSGIGNLSNTFALLIHSILEMFTVVDLRHDQEIACLKEMIARLEQRNIDAIEAYRQEIRREMDVVAESVEQTRRNILKSLESQN